MNRFGYSVDRQNGITKWYLNGLYHRALGPAIEDVDGQNWYYNGMRHRVDGPAITFAYGSKVWYYNGIYVKNT